MIKYESTFNAITGKYMCMDEYIELALVEMRARRLRTDGDRVVDFISKEGGLLLTKDEVISVLNNEFVYKAIRERVVDMERREVEIAIDRVHTFTPCPNGVGTVVDWFKRNRPQYLEQSKQLRVQLIYCDLKNADVRPVDEMTVWTRIDNSSNPLEIAREDVEQFFKTKCTV